MAAAKEEPKHRSAAAGACVLLVLPGLLVAVAFAIDEAAGVLLVVITATAALWRSARRRVSDMPATPPPRADAPCGDVFADETGEIARVVPIAEGVGFILHPVRDDTPPN